MASVLHLDASARSGRSLTRALSENVVKTWKAVHPSDRVVYRDLAADPPPHITEDWIASAFHDEAKRSEAQRQTLAISDKLVDEVLAADVIVIGTPMYNYGLPSTLKTWIDNVIRIGRTFTFDLDRGEQPIEPVQTGKVLVTCMSSGEGELALGAQNGDLNHVDTHLEAAMRLFGCSHQRVLRIEWQEFGDARHERSIETAHASVPTLVREVGDLIERADAA